jgi:hypothetical protein
MGLRLLPGLRPARGGVVITVVTAAGKEFEKFSDPLWIRGSEALDCRWSVLE